MTVAKSLVFEWGLNKPTQNGVILYGESLFLATRGLVGSHPVAWGVGDEEKTHVSRYCDDPLRSKEMFMDGKYMT